MLTPSEHTVEYALAYAGGEMLVRNPDSELEEIYPIDKWVRAQARFGHVYQRTVIVVTDWVEVVTGEE